MRNLLNYFAQGIFVIVPIGVTALILYRIFTFISTHLIELGLAIDPKFSPFLILLFIIVCVLFIGWLASNLFFKSFFGLIEKMMENLPMIKHIYSPVKDLMGAFVGNKKKFDKPVLVTTNPTAGIEELGFITQEQMTEFGINEKVAVYMPHSYAFSGRLFIVPSSNVRLLKNLNSSDAMKFIISGGVTEVEINKSNHI
jgi:uncharacterized membrane protein